MNSQRSSQTAAIIVGDPSCRDCVRADEAEARALRRYAACRALAEAVADAVLRADATLRLEAQLRAQA